jgi:hypothetical protein
MYPVAADLPALPRDQNVQALVSEPGPDRGQFSRSLPQQAAVPGLRSVVPGGVPETAQQARAANTEMKAVVYPLRDVPTPAGGQSLF